MLDKIVKEYEKNKFNIYEQKKIMISSENLQNNEKKNLLILTKAIGIYKKVICKLLEEKTIDIKKLEILIVENRSLKNKYDNKPKESEISDFKLNEGKSIQLSAISSEQKKHDINNLKITPSNKFQCKNEVPMNEKISVTIREKLFNIDSNKKGVENYYNKQDNIKMNLNERSIFKKTNKYYCELKRKNMLLQEIESMEEINDDPLVVLSLEMRPINYDSSFHHIIKNLKINCSGKFSLLFYKIIFKNH